MQTKAHLLADKHIIIVQERKQIYVMQLVDQTSKIQCLYYGNHNYLFYDME
jgi:16S rRNA G966 N2-methylase RsmD